MISFLQSCSEMTVPNGFWEICLGGVSNVFLLGCSSSGAQQRGETVQMLRDGGWSELVWWKDEGEGRAGVSSSFGERGFPQGLVRWMGSRSMSSPPGKATMCSTATMTDGVVQRFGTSQPRSTSEGGRDMGTISHRPFGSSRWTILLD